MRTSSAPFQLLLITGLLTACGGGGGGSNSGGPPAGQGSGGGATLTGRFIDGPVAGLRYTTPTLSGKTDANGTFVYQAGETVSFFVGDILIGRAPGAATITPFTLAGTTPPLSLLETNRAIRTVNLKSQAGSDRGAPVEVAANIAAFLQTLDEDGNPSNGQQIPAQIDTLATGVAIDFGLPSSEFVFNPAFRKLMADGRSAGVWNGQRAIKNPLLALDSLYSGLNLTPAIAFNAEFISTTSSVNTRVTSAYDVNANHFIQRTDVGDNKTIEKKITRNFDDNGFLSFEQVDMGDNGSIDNTTTYNFDATTGNLLSIEAGARAADGSIKPVGRSVYSYNPSGWLILEERQFKADGVVNVRISYSYDAKGNLIATTTDGNPNGTGLADGSVISKNSFTYDPITGRRILAEDDFDGNGTVDATTSFQYDPTSGNLLLVTTHSNVDGKDTSNTYSYNANGLSQTVHRTNGTVDRSVAYLYDAQGNQTALEFDANGDGTVDQRQLYSYDSDGTLTRRQDVEAATGTTQFEVKYTLTSPLGKWMALATQ